MYVSVLKIETQKQVTVLALNTSMNRLKYHWYEIT